MRPPNNPGTCSFPSWFPEREGGGGSANTVIYNKEGGFWELESPYKDRNLITWLLALRIICCDFFSLRIIREERKLPRFFEGKGHHGGQEGAEQRVDVGAGVRGLGHEERVAGLLPGLLQDPRDAQAKQEGHLPRQPRQRGRPHPLPTRQPSPVAGPPPPSPYSLRRSPSPRQLPHRKEEVYELLPLLYRSMKCWLPQLLHGL